MNLEIIPTRRKNPTALERIVIISTALMDSSPALRMGTMIATRAREPMSSSTADVMIPVAALLVASPASFKVTRLIETAVAVMHNPATRAVVGS